MTYPNVSEGWIQRFQTVYASSFGNDGHERHENTHKAVLEDTQPNDLCACISQP